MNTLFSHLEKYSNNIAILTQNSEITYKELLNLADEIGNKAKHRSLVLIACKNNFSSLAGYVGFIRAGVVTLLVSNDIENHLFSNLVKCYQPDYLYLPSEKIHSFQNYRIIYKHLWEN